MKRIVYKMLKKKKIVYKIIWTNVTRTNDAWTLDKCPKHLVSSHFCELRLHAKFQLPRLSRSQKKRWAPGGGWFWVQNNATLWLHLASWNLPDSQLS